jgi:transposase InsO family protein
VKLHTEEGIPVRQIGEETGVSAHTLNVWLRRYAAGGEAGLQTGYANRPGRVQIPGAVKRAMADAKRAEPTWGVTKISQFLRRVLHLPGSPETVRRTLHAERLIESKPPRPSKMPDKPRFFERSTPNQMWQSDIFTFRLGGKNAYLIGFIDDYSRFIVSLGVFRSQTAEHVLETYRRGVGEYGVPREMLTDNGRQYTSWRGSTRFEQELSKDKVKHIRSQPHHPMTLGKIERFWQNVNNEFLRRAQFDSFEQAQERIALWVKHYNHRRPHQGIGGMCPADRFFEVRSDLRKVIERGIQDNLVELALRGKPQRPFYMVGRVDGQSVVMQASKGKLVMTVGDGDNNQREEVLCDLGEGKAEIHESENGGAEGGAAAVHLGGEVQGGAGPVDGAQLRGGAVQGAGDDVEHAEPVAGAGDGGDGAVAGAEAVGPVREHAAEPAPAGPAGAEGGAPGAGGGGQPAAEEPGAGQAAEGPAEPAASGAARAVRAEPELTPELVARVLNLLASGLAAGYAVPCEAGAGARGGVGHAQTETGVGRGDAAPRPDAAGRDGGQENRERGGAGAGGVAQDVARVAAPRAGGAAGGHEPPASGAPRGPGGPGEGRAPERELGAEGPGRGAGALAAHPPAGAARDGRL